MKNLIFIDESGVNLAMVRLYARSLKGSRAKGAKPNRRGKNVSILAAISLKEVLTSVNLLGHIDGITFEAFIIRKLVPKLWKGACVLMDNYSIHKGEEIEKAINKAGAKLIFLPPYSPDFSPIENVWSKVKGILRTKYFDHILSEQILQGCKQIVILGSGLDTRPARKNTAGVKYFEIENETTLKFKEEILNANGIAANVSYIPGDYIKDNLIALLCQHQFNLNLPTYFIWEGNTSYLTEAEINLVLKQLRENVVEFRISFDYMSDRVISRSTGYSDMDDYMNKLEQMGAVWKSGFCNIENLANKVNLKVVDNFSTAELQKEYRPGSSLASNIFRFYFLCTLES